MVYVEPELNAIIFMELSGDRYRKNYNYTPEIVLGLRKLNKEKEIHFVVGTDQAPAPFVILFRQLKQENPHLQLSMYFKDQSEMLKKVLDKFNLKYNTIEDYPFELPGTENIIEEVNPFQELEGWEELEEQRLKSKKDNKEETDHNDKGN
jgi:hypothetical protein